MKIACGVAITALGLTVWAVPAGAADEFEKYALQTVSASLSNTEAGAHADFTTTITLTHAGTGGTSAPYALTRDIEVDMPPGLVGNPQAVPMCTVAQLGNLPNESECPLDSQIGITELTLGGTIRGTFTEPIYNMEPPRSGDIVARLGLFAAGWPAFINVRLDPSDYSLVASLEGLSSGAGLLEATTTIWGVPGSHAHDEQRLTPDEARKQESPPKRETTLPEAPFLSNPTDCGSNRAITVKTRSYQLPKEVSVMSAPFPHIIGCSRLSFSINFTALPTSPEAAAPTGLDTELLIPQDETPQGRATSALKSAVVNLPKGMTINAAAADGLGACSSEQVGFGTRKPSACPPAAKLGSASMEVPALEEPLTASLYQRTPETDHLFRFWLVTDEQGVYLKLPAEIEADPFTGQLSAVFRGIDSLGGLPQVPFSNFKLNIFGGPRAPLVTPGCGVHQTYFQFTPWSSQSSIENRTSMQIPNACEQTRFAPVIDGGTLRPIGGRFSPFVFELTRQDGEANPATIGIRLPKGILANIAGVPFCPDALADIGACPIQSKIGHLTVAVGVGATSLWIPQPGKVPTAAYLAGPYKGSPLSIVSTVPAQAGPFNLGTVVSRAAISVDPRTAAVTITTDPLPQFLEGVPITYRKIHVLVDRKHFILNPTNCSRKNFRATVVAAGGAKAEPTDNFQASKCGSLVYRPRMKLRFSGSTKRTGNPAVRAVLTQRPLEANNKAAAVILPRSQLIDNAHISNPCTRVQFADGACPKTSILGSAMAITPLLDKPLKGLVYFRSNGGARELPDLVADLKGSIHVVLVGYIDSVDGRIRTRFMGIPDAPITRFALNLFGGKRGLIENSRNLCKVDLLAGIRLAAQNGLIRSSSSEIAASCGKRR